MLSKRGEEAMARMGLGGPSQITLFQGPPEEKGDWIPNILT